VKTCIRCKTQQPIIEYPTVHNCSGGRSNVCRSCERKRKRAAYRRRQGARRVCQGCQRSLPLDEYPMSGNRVTRSRWCSWCTDQADARRRETAEHERYLASSERIARTDEELEQWCQEGYDALRANTDGARPVLSEVGDV
jgi:hypothetical protein